MKLKSFNQEIARVLLLGFIFVSAVSVGYSQSPLPEGYPKLMDTGNPVEDHRKYDAAKQAWIAANPEAYRKMTGEGNTNVLSQKPASENKRTETHAESNPVMIPPYNPDALTLQKNSTEEDLNVSAISKFKDFPVYKDTGNPEEDAERYNKAEAEWYLLHEEAYKEVMKSKSNNEITHISDVVNTEKPNTEKPNKIIISQSQFNQLSPEKQTFIEKNTDLYLITQEEVAYHNPKQKITGGEFLLLDAASQRRVLSKPEEIEVIKTGVHQSEFDKMPLEKQTIILSHPDFFIIVKE